MKLEDINIEFDAESERTAPDNPEIHYIDAVNMETLRRCHMCGSPMLPKTKNYRPIIHYCKGPTGEKHIYHINLCSQRYECTNPHCAHSVTAGMISHKSPYTDEYKKHVIRLFLNTEKCSFREMARMLKISQPIVSNLIKNYTKDVNTRFAPDIDTNSFYFHGFKYYGKYRYFLTGIGYSRQPKLLSFFGFTDDTWQEVEFYLQQHFNDGTHYWFYTDGDNRLNTLLTQTVKESYILQSRYATDQKIEDFLIKYSGMVYFNQLDNELQNFKKMLISRNFRESYEQWHLSFQTKEAGLQGALEDFYDMFKDEYDPSFAYQENPDHKDLISKVQYYKSQRLPFDVMVLKMMHFSHKEAIFEDVALTEDEYSSEQEPYSWMFRSHTMDECDDGSFSWEIPFDDPS